nr:SgcJ/EcaC family oxidoreductase [uncultured Pseudomonas sp.]
MKNKHVDATIAALSAIESDWNRAASRWDSSALAAVYTSNALFFGGRPGHYMGREAIREYFASYEGTLRSGSIALSELAVISLATGCVLAQGFADFMFELADGEITRSRLRGTLVLQEQDGTWMIRQHHFSTSPLVPPLRAAE